MTARLPQLLTALVLLVASARAQEGAEEPVLLELRVSGTAQDEVVMVDRGSRDGVAVGDPVRLYPRTGGTISGTVVTVQERSATVELDLRGPVPSLGTRGDVRLPADRRVAGAVEPPRPPAVELSEHPPWTNPDEDFTPDQPLLAEVAAVRPEDRARKVTGRYYLVGDWIETIDEARRDWFLRTGADVLVENPFGRGGGLHVDAELNLRRTELIDQLDQDGGELRLDRLSYYRGADRFSEDGFEVGRFLQNGMPELGVIDGYETIHRVVGGNAYGLSLGFLPEPSKDFESGHDFQVAGWYHWEPLDRALTVDGGIQKTFHNGNADRDLLVLRVQSLSDESWDFHGTAWVDYYTSGDTKGAGLELTELRLSTGRRWESGNGLDFSFTLLRFPDIDRIEFLPPDPADLVDNDLRRLSANGWRYVLEDVRLTAYASIWGDEDDSGGDAEVGVELEDAILDRSVTGLAIFDNHAQFADVLGARLTYRLYRERFHWDLLAELARQRQVGFGPGFEDLPRARGRAGFGFRTSGGWDVSVYGEGEAWQEDYAWSVGFHAQRYF